MVVWQTLDVEKLRKAWVWPACGATVAAGKRKSWILVFKIVN
jgi:hypothetical protein